MRTFVKLIVFCGIWCLILLGTTPSIITAMQIDPTAANSLNDHRGDRKTYINKGSQGELVPIRLSVERKLHFDLDVYLFQERMYLSANKLLSLLHIKYIYDKPELQVFFPDPTAPIRINLEQLLIQSPTGTSLLMEEDFILLDGEVSFSADFLKQHLEMHVEFDYRKLSLSLHASQELPVLSIHERKEQYMQFNLPPPALSTDAQLPGQHHLLNGWVTDWSLNGTDSGINRSYSYRLSLGGHFLGGDMAVSGAGSTHSLLYKEQLRAQWRYPFYTAPLIKQLQVGNITHQSSAGRIHNAFRGLQISNRPLAPRQTFSTLIYNGTLNPGWDMELYVNNTLKDFALGSETSDFHLESPLSYGSNFVELKYYDATGGFAYEKRHIIHVPQEFLPVGKVQYSIAAGRYMSAGRQSFSHGDFQWGISPYLTIGGGSSFLSASSRVQPLPFVQFLGRFESGVTVTGSHTFSQRTDGSLKILFNGLHPLSLKVHKYYNTSFFNPTGKSFDTLFNTSFPLTIASVRLSPFIRTRYLHFHSNNKFLSLYSGLITQLPMSVRWHINSRLSFHSYSTRPLRASQFEVESQLSKRITRNLLLKSNLHYNFRLHQISQVQLQLHTRLSSRYQLEFLFQRNNLVRNSNIHINFRMNLPFVRHTSTLRTHNKATSLYHHTSGSVSFNNRWQNFHLNEQQRTGRAGLVLKAYLDTNNNGQKDPGEADVKGVTGDLYRQGNHQPSYRAQHSFDRLIPYETYRLNVNHTSIDNPLVIPRFTSYSIQVPPNMFTTVSIPLLVTGELSGYVEAVESYRTNLHGIDISLYTSEDTFLETITTFRGGEFYYIGLRPGSYKVVINQEQLEQKNLFAEQDTIHFKIEADEQGDIVEGLTFKILPPSLKAL